MNHPSEIYNIAIFITVLSSGYLKVEINNHLNPRNPWVFFFRLALAEVFLFLVFALFGSGLTLATTSSVVVISMILHFYKSKAIDKIKHAKNSLSSLEYASIKVCSDLEKWCGEDPAVSEFITKIKKQGRPITNKEFRFLKEWREGEGERNSCKAVYGQESIPAPQRSRMTKWGRDKYGDDTLRKQHKHSEQR